MLMLVLLHTDVPARYPMRYRLGIVVFLDVGVSYDTAQDS